LLCSPVLLQRRSGGLVKLSTLRIAATCAFLFAARLSASQSVALSLSPVKTNTDGTFRSTLLNAPSTSAPAGLQWTFRIPPGFEIVRIEAAKAAKAAAKTLVCNGAKCIVYGLNRTTIPNGPIAMLKIKVGQSLVGRDHSAPLEYPALGRARTKKPRIWINDPIAASLNGKVIPVAPGTSSRPIR